MQWKVVFPVLALTAVMMAGCSGKTVDPSSADAIAVSGSGTTYTFTANTDGDAWAWDFGDHSPAVQGKEATHTYAFPNGAIQVKLTTTKGGIETASYHDLSLGTGANQSPTFILDAQTNWTVPGETVRFTATASSDPDLDPLLYTWSCLRERDLVRQTPHPHPFTGGVNFASPPAGAVTARNAKIPFPTADHVYSGDLCEGLGTGGELGHDATIEGAFAKQGLYTITLLATDGKIPTTAGRYQVWVSPLGERPAPIVRAPFDATLLAGRGGNLQGALEPVAGNQTFDRASIGFSLPLAARPVSINLTFDTSNPANQITWALTRGDRTIATGGAAEPLNTVVPRLETGSYTFTVELQAGADVHVTGEVVSHLLMDPTTIY
jgi:PKD repeat protein